MVDRHRRIAACAAALVLAAPAVAARPAYHHHARAPLPGRSTVTVHHGFAVDTARPGGDEDSAPLGYREADYGREDDAAIFAARYGCARPIWNAKSNRYMSACN